MPGMQRCAPRPRRAHQLREARARTATFCTPSGPSRLPAGERCLLTCRSVTMDSWSPQQLKMMQAGGNDALNSFMAVRDPPGLPARFVWLLPHFLAYVSNLPAAPAAIRHSQGDRAQSEIQLSRRRGELPPRLPPGLACFALAALVARLSRTTPRPALARCTETRSRQLPKAGRGRLRRCAHTRLTERCCSFSRWC